MATKQERVNQLIARIQQDYPGYWESLQPMAQDRIRRAAVDTIDANGGWWAFKAVFTTFPSFVNWQTQNAPADPTEEPTEEDVDEPPPDWGTTTNPTSQGDDIRQILLQFLRDNGLPDSLNAFINDALAKGMTATEIVARLRQTPEYLAAYPENGYRQQNGFSWIPESQVRAMRDEIRRLTSGILNVNLTGDEIARIIGKDKSLSEWESQLKTWKEFQRWGPTVRSVLESELGYSIPDDRVFAFMSTDITTPELDAAYERALLRGQPALLGLGIRPEDEAELLRRYGISPEQAFRGYQGIVGELPAVERWSMIENNINQNAGQFPGGSQLFADTPFATLFRAIQLGDASAIRTLQEQMSREVARFQATGGAARSGTELIGLLPGGQQQG